VAEVRFHPEAQAEYQAALAWYHARSQQAADRFEAEVERVLGSVAANPAMFPLYDDEHRFATLRRFPFSVVYQVLPDGVCVIALAHSRRRPGYWQGRA
jgi:plasmid stabilization system protein ParE